VEAAERAQKGYTPSRATIPHREGWRDTDWFKRAIPVKLIAGLNSSRVLTTFAVHATWIVHASTQPNFHVNRWAAGPCELIELTPLPDKREEILELLRFSVGRLTGRLGCLSSGVYEAGDEKHAILYLERWVSEEALHRHIQSNLYRGVLNALDLSREPRGISFHEISETKSMELILALRTASVG
jgi:quinol monooxygenase YgiN